MCQCLKFSTLDLQRQCCNFISLMFSIRVLYIQWHTSWSCPKLNFSGWCETLVSRAGLCFSSRAHAPSSPWAYLWLLGALNTAYFPSSMQMARAPPSKFQILTPLPVLHQNHQVSHLPASFRLFLVCSMKNICQSPSGMTINNTEQPSSNLAGHLTDWGKTSEVGGAWE